MASSRLTTQLRNRISSSNPIENERTLSDLPGEIAKDITKSVAAAPADFFNQLLSVGDYAVDNSHQEKNDSIKPYEKFTLYSSDRKNTQEQPKESPKTEVTAAMNYHAEVVHTSERSARRENRELQYQIQEIVAELQRLVDSSNKIIQMEFGSFSVSAAPTAVGKYHTNFFSWMLTVIRTARQKVEDSAAWIAVAKGKGHKRGYKQSSKAHGTSFTQSNERQVSTQSG